MGLSQARADALKAFVVACGIEPDRVYAVGFAGTRRLTGDVIDEVSRVGRVRPRCLTLPLTWGFRPRVI